MGNARILMANVPRLLSGVVSGIVAEHSEFRIVGETGVGDMLAAIDVLRPTVVVVGTDNVGSVDASLDMLKARHPLLRVVTIDSRGREAVAYEPGEAPRFVAEVSPEMLLQMLWGFDDRAGSGSF